MIDLFILIGLKKMIFDRILMQKTILVIGLIFHARAAGMRENGFVWPTASLVVSGQPWVCCGSPWGEENDNGALVAGWNDRRCSRCRVDMH